MIDFDLCVHVVHAGRDKLAVYWGHKEQTQAAWFKPGG